MPADDEPTPARLDDLMREAVELAARVNRRLSERAPLARQIPVPSPPHPGTPGKRPE
jgi:hypothetical protein